LAGSQFLTGKFRYIFWGGWLLFGACQTALLYWFGFNWQIAIQDSFSSNILLAIACWLISNNLYYYRPKHSSRYLYIALSCIILAVLWLALIHYLLPMLPDIGPDYVLFLFKSLPIRLFTGFLLISWLAMISLLWYSQQDQIENDKRQADIEKLAREAELFKLRQQLQPHFLFNSLNSINALIGSQPKDARKMIQQLSDFLRSTLKKEDHQWVTLAEEIQHLALYLDIEKMRFGHRLETNITFDEETATKKLPPMLLQPLVENAIKFGLYDTTDDVTISITASTVDNMLSVSVQNPFDPQTTPPRKGTGFGLNGVRRRLDLLFGRQDLLLTQSPSDHIFNTTIKIPQA